MSVTEPQFEDLTITKALEVERSHYALAGTKERVIAERFGLSPVRYHQLLNRMLATTEAIETDPVTVRLLTSRQSRHRISPRK